MSPQTLPRRIQPICRFLFLFILIVSAISTAVTSVRMSDKMSAQITVRPRTNPIQLNQETWVDITLPDAGNLAAQSKMPSDVLLTITLTTLSDAASAKRGAEWRTNSPLEWDSLLLKATRDGHTNEANVIQGRLPVGRKSFTLKVRSERAGALRLFVEGAGVGSATINVLGPSQLGVTVNPVAVRLGREAQLDISLLDYQGKSVKADRNLQVTVTITTLETLGYAKQGRAMHSKLLERSLIALSKGATTARLTGMFPSGKERVSLRFRTDVVGAVRIFVESVGFGTGRTLVSPIVQAPNISRLPGNPIETSRMLQPAGYFIPAMQPAQTAKGRLQIWKIDSSTTSDETVEFHEFYVTLEPDSHNELVLPSSTLTIKFDQSPSGRIAPVIEPEPVIIPANTNRSRVLTLSYGCRGTVNLVAKSDLEGVEQSSRFGSQAANFDFTPPRRADRLELQAIPDRELADGRKAITLKVKVLDACDAEIKTADESENMGDRLVDLSIADGKSVRFDDNSSTLRISANESRAEKKIYPVTADSVKLTATTSTTDPNVKEIKTDLTISFYFPFWQLACAVFGGLVCCPLLCLVIKQVPLLFSGSSRKQGVSWVSVFGVRWGVLLSGTLLTAILGGILYGFLFYGALSTSDPQVEKSSWGKTIIAILTRLSTQDYFASWLIGLLGSAALILLFWLALKGWQWRRSSTGKADGEPPLNEPV